MNTRSHGRLQQELNVFAIHPVEGEDGWVVTAETPQAALDYFHKEFCSGRGKIHYSDTLEENWLKGCQQASRANRLLPSYMEKFVLLRKEYYIELLLPVGRHVGWIPARF